MLNEADTRAKLVDRKLRKAGWEEELITREHYSTKGRIHLHRLQNDTQTELDRMTESVLAKAFRGEL